MVGDIAKVWALSTQNSLGSLKKVGAMKIIHEKYSSKGSQAEKAKEVSEIYSTAIKHDPSIRPFLLKIQEEITPIVALHLFEAMTPIDCMLAGITNQKMNPCDLLWRVLPVPPVCIRPSIGHDGSRYLSLWIRMNWLY